MGAPICTTTPTPASQTFASPLVNSIPVASDLPSAIAAVNALRQVINGMFGANTQGNGGNSGTGQAPLKPGGGFSVSQFQQSNQTVTKVRIYDPNDPSKQTYVDVNQVTSLTMTNPITKETWKWSQPPQQPGS